jgi:hypothetical protein
MKLDDPDLTSPADLMEAVLYLEHGLPPFPRKFFKVSKASTFASSARKIPLDIHLLSRNDIPPELCSLIKLKRFLDLSTLCRVPANNCVIPP